MKLKKKEYQSMGALDFLGKGNNLLSGVILEIKCGAETERKAIQILSYLGIHLIDSHQTQTLFWML